MTRTIAVVGSGFAAWGAVRALAWDDDVCIHIFDVGLTRATSDWAHRTVHNAKKCDGSFYSYGINDPDFPTQLESQRLCSSHALGGHSNVYSGAMLYPKNHDLCDWPQASWPRVEDYTAVLSSLAVLHEPDALDAVFPVIPEAATVGETPRSGTVSVVGLSRIATSRSAVDSAQDAAIRPFSLRDEFERWVSAGAVQYTGGCYVTRVTSREGRVELSYTVGGVPGAATFDAVFLGAGCVNTTAIVDRSLNQSGTRHYSIQSPLLAMHAFFRFPGRANPAVQIRRRNDVPELFLELRSPGTGDSWSHTQLTAINEQIVEAICARVPRLLHPLVRQSRHLVYFALSLQASHGHELARLQSNVESDGTRQKVSIEELPCGPVPQLVRDVRRAVLRHWRTLRMLPIPYSGRLVDFFRGNRLGGWHFGGTLPMREQPSLPTECWPTGEIQGLAGVYVLDSSAFPSIPASTAALLTMANGHRVASCWISRLVPEDC